MISELLKNVMSSHGLKQADLAELLEVSLSRVKAMTSGRVKNLTREECELLIAKLGIRAEWLVTGEGPMHEVATPEVAAKMVGNIPAALAALRGRRTHAVVAKKADVSAEDWADFEAKRRPVSSAFIKKVIVAFPEADPMEILGGQKREISTRDYREVVLLENFRRCTAAAQKLIQQQAALLASTS